MNSFSHRSCSCSWRSPLLHPLPLFQLILSSHIRSSNPLPYTMRSYALLSLAAVAMAFEAPPPIKNQIAGPILGIYAMCGNDPIDCGQGWCCLKGQQCVTDAKNIIMCYDPDLSEANKYVDAMCCEQIHPDCILVSRLPSTLHISARWRPAKLRQVTLPTGLRRLVE